MYQKLRVQHKGEIGDIIAFLPILKILGGGTLVVTNQRREYWRHMPGKRLAALRPLLEAQSYCHGVEEVEDPDEPKGIHLDYSRAWENVIGKYKYTLTQAQGWWAGVDPQDPEINKPWIELQGDIPQHGKIVINRTDRHTTGQLPYHRLARREDCIFIGHPDEHDRFQKSWFKLPYVPTKDYLEIAKLIAGASLYVGNQSSCFWVAAGLQTTPVIQENWNFDSKVGDFENTVFFTSYTNQRKEVREKFGKVLL